MWPNQRRKLEREGLLQSKSEVGQQYKKYLPIRKRYAGMTGANRWKKKYYWLRSNWAKTQAVVRGIKPLILFRNGLGIAGGDGENETNNTTQHVVVKKK